MADVEDENLVYRSPSEMSNIQSDLDLEYDNLKPELDSSENILLPITGSFEVSSPDEGSITRYSNIFDELDDDQSDDEDCNQTLRDLYADACEYNYNVPSESHDDLNNEYKSANNDDDLHGEKSLTFSDRVVKERERMIRKRLLSIIYSNRYNSNRIISVSKHRPHDVEQSYFFLKDNLDEDLDDQIVEKHKRIHELLESQKGLIRDIKSNNNRSDESYKKLLQIQQENARLLSENQQNCETIRNLKIDIENIQSDLIVERRQNEQLLKDKVELQNKVSILSKENKSLLTSQEIMQNMHNNEIEDLNSKKLELSTKISNLQRDLDFFRDSLQESHKMNEMLKAEMSSLMDVYNNDKAHLQKLKVENKRLMENNSIYKSQNYSLIEINDRLRKRTLFYAHSGELTTTNSSTVTNASTGTNGRSSPALASHSTIHSSYSTNSDDDQCLEPSFEVCNQSNAIQTLNSTETSPNNSDSEIVSPNSNTIASSPDSGVSNGCQLDLVLNNIDDNHDTLNILSSNLKSFSYGDLSRTCDRVKNGSYNVVELIGDTKITNPATKWVTDHVSRNSSVEALENLRKKIKNITIESNVENVNINSSLKCFQSNVTINLIQNKLQLISQRLNETIV